MKHKHFVEQRLQYKFLRERNNRYQHIICSIVFDKSTKKYQSFCRGEAFTIFENCTDFWNGEQVVPITETAKRTIKELMQHWNSNNFDPIGYSYKPVTPDVQKMLEFHWNDGKVFDKELGKSQTER